MPEARVRENPAGAAGRVFARVAGLAPAVLTAAVLAASLMAASLMAPGRAHAQAAEEFPSDGPPPAPPVLPLAPVEPQPGAIVIDGDGVVVGRGCAGRDVLIHSSDSRITLTGGCRTITVQGRADQIRADLQSGARIAVGGDKVTLHYTLAPPGRPPFLSVTGTGSTATFVRDVPDVDRPNLDRPDLDRPDLDRPGPGRPAIDR